MPPHAGPAVEHGRKVRCHMPPRADRRTAENEVCNAVISNTRHDISSHISRQHEERAHYRDTKKNPNNPWLLPYLPTIEKYASEGEYMLIEATFAKEQIELKKEKDPKREGAESLYSASRGPSWLTPATRKTCST
ncbi:hypothetical protein PG985_014438 [Apiospora marii]|uniref:uncharacterized protein n=1 Tax=Apiospora marii TaxID=335849 RepID=UPI00312CECA2